jgi:hypothetical protein
VRHQREARAGAVFTIAGVADESTEDKTSAPSRRAVETARQFAKAHGGSARAVVENIGQAGTRVVLIGEDGTFGDLVVDGVDQGAQLVEQVEGLTGSEWDTETTGKLQISAAHRKRMAGPRAR